MTSFVCASLVNCVDYGLGWDYMARQLDIFRYTNALFCTLLSAYTFFYFRGQTVWKWIFFNSISMFTAFLMDGALKSTGTAGGQSVANHIVSPIALIFWSMGEMGDVVLFYKRFGLVHVTEIPIWLQRWFQVWLSFAIVVRLIDIGYAAFDGGLHSATAKYIEPCYFFCLWMIEVVLQYKYFITLVEMRDISRDVFMSKLIRSAGARFVLISVPMFCRIIAQMAGSVTSPWAVVFINFSTAVNLFSMFDLLLLKYEMAEMKNAAAIEREASKQQVPLSLKASNDALSGSNRTVTNTAASGTLKKKPTAENVKDIKDPALAEQEIKLPSIADGQMSITTV
eukprot:TRINITY_DN8488_c0_g1_i1.p1 TRINITY_DN8488_c0_g1~~TRINITY_DN8488_c0_g1_i1.p1  ORF type:complete len:339 (-),score=79.91 TRINITY_DN8488_c0_g1_i1:102-1118(-)